MTPKPSPVELPRGVFRWRGLLSVAVFGPGMLAALLSPLHFPGGSLGAWACDTAGLALLCAGILIRSWAILFVGGRKTRQLVQSGPYALCRHPLYLGTLLVGASVPCFLQSLSLLAAALLLLPLVLLAVIREEERILARGHPQEFADYARRVPRLIPRSLAGAASDGDAWTVSLKALRLHLRRSGVCLLIPPALALLNHWRGTGSIPALLRLP